MSQSSEHGVTKGRADRRADKAQFMGPSGRAGDPKSINYRSKFKTKSYISLNQNFSIFMRIKGAIQTNANVTNLHVNLPNRKECIPRFR